MGKQYQLRPIYMLRVHVQREGVKIRTSPRGFDKYFPFSDETNDDKGKIGREELGELSRIPNIYERVGAMRYLSNGQLLPTSQSQRLEKIVRERICIIKKDDGKEYLKKYK